jgi:hypothetical protein
VKDVTIGFRSAAIAIMLGMSCTAAVLTQPVPTDRPSLAGVWTLDWYLSDNPEQVAEALRIDTGQRGNEAFAQESGRGGAPRAQPRQTRQMSADDQRRLQELTDEVQFPAPTVTISQTATDITFARPNGPARTLRTDGTREKHRTGAGVVDRTATWEGPQLLVAYEVGDAGRLTYTYSRVPTTKQLLIKVNFERERMAGPFEIKLVYNAAPAR